MKCLLHFLNNVLSTFLDLQKYKQKSPFTKGKIDFSVDLGSQNRVHLTEIQITSK